MIYLKKFEDISDYYKEITKEEYDSDINSKNIVPLLDNEYQEIRNRYRYDYFPIYKTSDKWKMSPKDGIIIYHKDFKNRSETPWYMIHKSDDEYYYIKSSYNLTNSNHPVRYIKCDQFAGIKRYLF